MTTTSSLFWVNDLRTGQARRRRLCRPSSVARLLGVTGRRRTPRGGHARGAGDVPAHPARARRHRRGRGLRTLRRRLVVGAQLRGLGTYGRAAGPGLVLPLHRPERLPQHRHHQRLGHDPRSRPTARCRTRSSCGCESTGTRPTRSGPRPPDVARATARPFSQRGLQRLAQLRGAAAGLLRRRGRSTATRPIGETWVEVLHIVKPAYQLDVSTNRRAYLAGEGVRVAVSARFFDGTAVPGAPLTVQLGSQWRSATTNATGRTVARVKARADDWTQMTRQAIEARPKRAEEGEISGGTGIIVLPSSYYLDARVTRGGGEIRARGAVHAVDLSGTRAADRGRHRCGPRPAWGTRSRRQGDRARHRDRVGPTAGRHDL